MKDNWNIRLVGSAVVLVPYRHRFVERYHEWMKDPFLLETTASEPLSLDEEYTMQATWHNDPKKVTFIVLSKAVLESDLEQSSEVNREFAAMAGDVNMFLNDPDDPGNAEIEIMIAEPAHRRKGLAREALQMMIGYGVTKLKLTRFFAKIGEANVASLELFKSLGFKEIAYVKAFGEYELELLVPSAEGGVRDIILQWALIGSTEPYTNGEDDDDD
jgi:RimJ/RimL family protein N-acetyltransferase